MVLFWLYTHILYQQLAVFVDFEHSYSVPIFIACVQAGEELALQLVEVLRQNDRVLRFLVAAGQLLGYVVHRIGSALVGHVNVELGW